MEEKFLFPPQEVYKDFEKARTINKEEDSENKAKKDPKERTVLDYVGVPKKYTDKLDHFLEWFEPRFGNLQTKEDVERVSRSIQEAADVLERMPYLLLPKESEKNEMGISRNIKERVSRGFQNRQEILGFFKKVSIDIENPKKQKDILVPNRRSQSGAEKLSRCRILSMAYVLEIIRNNQDFKNFFKNARTVLGEVTEEDSGKEAGILPLLTRKEIEILRNPSDEFKILDWLERGEVLKGSTLLVNGVSYVIPEIHISIKGGARALQKMLRDPHAESLGMLDDLFRLRFIINNGTSNEEVVNLLEDIEKNAKSKKNPKISIKFRAKNYFSEEEEKKYFGAESQTTFGETSDEEEYSSENPKIKNGRVKNITFYKNPLSGSAYKNISAKISLYKNDNNPRKPFFSFELQIMRESEYEMGEDPESSAYHFPIEMKALDWVISRMNGKLTKEEIINLIEEYLKTTVNTEKMPPVLVGEVEELVSENKKGGKTKEKAVRKKTRRFLFKGPIKDKAIIIFNFLLQTGSIKKVTPNYPTRENPTPEQKNVSRYYINEIQKTKMLDLIKAKRTKKRIVK